MNRKVFGRRAGKRMPEWLQTWLIGFIAYLGVPVLGAALFGVSRHDPSLPTLAFGALVAGGVLSWLLTVGARPKPPQ